MAFNQSLINDRAAGELVTWPLYWLALVLFCFVWNLGGAPLFDVDEGAFSEATREMLARGDFLTTYLNDALRFDKPILIYWLQAAAVGIFGLHEWSFRLPSALAASGWVLAVLIFSRRFLDERSALLAATFTGTALGPLVIGRAATADALLHLCLAAALFDIYRFAASGDRRCVLRTFLWMGLGTLTKGPVALLIPFLVSGIYFATRNDIRKWLRAIFDPLGWLILLVIAAPWYVLELREQGQAFIAGFFMKHNVGRFTGTMQGHGGNLFYYAPAILLVTLPFSGLFLRLLPALRQQWRDPLDRFLWIWFIVVYVLFSLSKTQLPHYILYGATPLFVLMARHRQLLRSRWLPYLPSILLLTILVLLPEILATVRIRTHDIYVAEMLAVAPSIFDPSYRIGAALALTAVCATLFAAPRDVGNGLAIAAFVQAIMVIGLLLPRLAELQQGPVKAAAQFTLARPEPVVAWGINVPSFSVYRNAVTPSRKPLAGELVLTRRDKLSELPPHNIVFTQGGVLLVKIGGRND